jgi:hypothetical protein
MKIASNDKPSGYSGIAAGIIVKSTQPRKAPKAVTSVPLALYDPLGSPEIVTLKVSPPLAVVLPVAATLPELQPAPVNTLTVML